MIYFKEVQRFNQWWLWLLILLISVAPLYNLYEEIKIKGLVYLIQYNRQEFLTPIVIFSVLLVFLFIRLKTTIHSNYIHLNYSILVNKKIPFEIIKNVRIINYGFVGGWGIRFFTKHGTVYNVKGTVGVAITLKSGKQMVIGTQKAEELSRALKKANLLK